MVTKAMVNKEDLKEMYSRKRWNIYKIAKETGLNRNQIDTLIMEYGITRSGKPRKGPHTIERPDGYTTINGIPYHRWLWEKNVGEIPDGWVIHHINGIKSDNRLENLVAIPRNRQNKEYIIKATKKRLNEVEKENSELKELVNAYEEYISKMPE